MSDQPGVSTGEPIYKAAATVGTVVAGALGLVGTAAQLGILSASEAGALNDAGAQITSALPELAGAITLIVGVISGIGASLLTAWQARKSVVPRDSDAFTVVPIAAAAPTRLAGDGVGDHRVAE